MIDIQVGMKLWFFDPNRRVYPKGGGMGSSPIYREHFAPCNVIGETKVSWIVGRGPQEYARVPKNQGKWRTLDFNACEGVYRTYFFTQQAIDDAVFVHEYGYRIQDSVRKVKSAQVLREIAKLTGYEIWGLEHQQKAADRNPKAGT